MKNLTNHMWLRIRITIWKLGDDSIQNTISLNYYNNLNILIKDYMRQEVKTNIYHPIKFNL